MSWKLLESCWPVRLNKIAPMLLTTAYATNASIALPSADRIKSGIFRTGRAIGTSSLPPKNAAAYAATSAASRINWRSNPKRQPRTTSNKINTTAKERKTACQTSEPAVGCGSGVTATTDGLLPQCVIAKHQRGHRFHNWHCSRKNARIMASARRELALLL